MTRIITLFSKLLNYDDVLQPDHLIQEEVEPENTHLPTHSTELTKPIVALLGDGSVEEPSPILLQHLGESRRIAVLLAKLVFDGVLVEKMPHVDDESNVVEEWIWPLEYLLQSVACRIVDDHVRLSCAGNRARLLQKKLDGENQGPDAR